jgi:hypothetical protein
LVKDRRGKERHRDEELEIIGNMKESPLSSAKKLAVSVTYSSPKIVEINTSVERLKRELASPESIFSEFKNNLHASTIKWCSEQAIQHQKNVEYSKDVSHALCIQFVLCLYFFCFYRNGAKGVISQLQKVLKVHQRVECRLHIIVLPVVQIK